MKLSTCMMYLILYIIYLIFNFYESFFTNYFLNYGTFFFVCYWYSYLHSFWKICLKFVYEIFSNFIVLSVKIFFLVVHFVGWLFYFKVNSNRSDCPILVPIWFSFLEPKSTKPNCNFFATFSRWTPSNFRFCVFCPKTWKNTFSR